MQFANVEIGSIQERWSTSPLFNYRNCREWKMYGIYSNDWNPVVFQQEINQPLKKPIKVYIEGNKNDMDLLNNNNQHPKFHHH